MTNLYLCIAFASAIAFNSVCQASTVKRSGHWLELNKNSSRRLLEGDIYARDENAATRSKSHLWTHNTVVYDISNELRRCRRTILSAMKEISDNTCVKFRQRNHEFDYIQFIKDDGCWSEVGSRGGRQESSFGNGCCFKDIIQHELFHTLGFYHEHNRPDRDENIVVDWRHIARNMASQFRKQDARFVTVFGTEFDFQSIMLYDSYSFSKDGKRTMYKKSDGSTIKEPRKISSTDYYELNRLYGCSNEVQ